MSWAFMPIGICGIIAIIVGIVRAYREKEARALARFVIVLGFIMFFMFVSAILNQHTLVWIFMASAAVVAMASLPSVKKYNERKMKEALASVDLSASLRLRDLFITRTGWAKFVYRWGAGKTLFIVWLLMTPIIVGLPFALNLWLKFMSIKFTESFIISYITCSTGSLILCYYALKSALKEKKLPERESVYRSVNTEDLYRKLLDVYIPIWGSRLGGTSALERNIQSCMKQGFNREEAIRKIAAWGFEGIPWET